MTVAPEHMVLPPTDARGREDLSEIAELVSAADPELVGHGGQRVALPGAVRDALVHVLAALRAGQAVAVGPFPTLLRTQQAADLLGVSRPTLIKMLEDGRLPYERPGDHRRIRLEDVLAYRASRRIQRQQGMTELIRQTEDLGLYEDGPHDEPRVS
jgi:excisionase family DNA binding protein